MENEEKDPTRFCNEDEQWVCIHCGKHVDNDRYDFADASCMLNAIKVDKDCCEYADEKGEGPVTRIKEYFIGDLVDGVKQWGKDRELHDPIMQYAKMNEEVGEIAHELTRGNLDSEELKDAIGDTAVTLIILADILGFNFEECLRKAYKEIKGRTGKTENGSFVKDA